MRQGGPNEPPAFECVSHVQLSMPAGPEDDMRHFYGTVLGMTEIAKPPVLPKRGGAWVPLRRGGDPPGSGTGVPACQEGTPRDPGGGCRCHGNAACFLRGRRRVGRSDPERPSLPRSRSRGQSPGIRAAGAIGKRRPPAVTGTRSRSRGHRWAAAYRPAHRLSSPLKHTAAQEPRRTPIHSRKYGAAQGRVTDPRPGLNTLREAG